MAEQNAKQVGELTEEELNLFAQSRNVATQLIQQLGAIELRKSRIVAQINANEQSAQELLASARERVGLDLTTPWQIRDDGAIFAISSDEESSSEES
jgi:hypothetical protein